jgi:hypothetical protein
MFLRRTGWCLDLCFLCIPFIACARLFSISCKLTWYYRLCGSQSLEVALSRSGPRREYYWGTATATTIWTASDSLTSFNLGGRIKKSKTGWVTQLALHWCRIRRSSCIYNTMPAFWLCWACYSIRTLRIHFVPIFDRRSRRAVHFTDTH